MSTLGVLFRRVRVAVAHAGEDGFRHVGIKRFGAGGQRGRVDGCAFMRRDERRQPLLRSLTRGGRRRERGEVREARAFGRRGQDRRRRRRNLGLVGRPREKFGNLLCHRFVCFDSCALFPRRTTGRRRRRRGTSCVFRLSGEWDVNLGALLRERLARFPRLGHRRLRLRLHRRGFLGRRDGSLRRRLRRGGGPRGFTLELADADSLAEGVVVVGVFGAVDVHRRRWSFFRRDGRRLSL
mmetsp:Transcript_9926/g.45280  ORF Transcript_9926/g.45280 Transcript_9926/m.45280 type:complete len:238 (+) Transcript_9926:79-792(+)